MLRGVVFSIRPTVARSVGLVTSIDDLFNADGVRAWSLGLLMLQNGCAEQSALGPRFVEWIQAEVAAERLRWRTLHVLAESIESRLKSDGPDATWCSSASNTLAFAARVRHVEAVLTADVVDRLTKIVDELNCLHGTAHWQSLECLIEELSAVLKFPVHDLPDDIPTLVNHMFTDDLASWLQSGL